MNSGSKINYAFILRTSGGITSDHISLIRNNYENIIRDVIGL